MIMKDYVTVKNYLQESNMYVVIREDVIFVVELGLFVTVYRGICFLTQEYIPKRTNNILNSALNIVINFYHTHDFNINVCITYR